MPDSSSLKSKGSVASWTFSAAAETVRLESCLPPFLRSSGVLQRCRRGGRGRGMGGWDGLHVRGLFERLRRNGHEYGAEIVCLEMTVANWSSFGGIFVGE